MSRKTSPGPDAGPAVEVVGLDTLTPDAANLRIHPQRNRETIAASLRQFGPGRSLVVDGKRIVRAGNGTLEAARDAGITEVLLVEPKPHQLVAVSRPDWSPAEGVGYSIVDNHSTDQSMNNEPALLETLEAIRDEGDIPLEALGFTDAEVDAMAEEIARADAADAADDPDAAAGDDFTANFVAFKLGDYTGRVSKAVYESFRAAFQAHQDAGDDSTIDGVLRAWLNV